LRLSIQETASEEGRKMGERLERGGREMKGWNVSWCSRGEWRDPWTLWREMSGTPILLGQGGREEGIHSLRRVKTLEGKIVHSRQGGDPERVTHSLWDKDESETPLVTNTTIPSHEMTDHSFFPRSSPTHLNSV